MTEQEKKARRCCFTGHRPEKLGAPEELVIRLLDEAIGEALEQGFRTFISGCAKGVDLWAAELVLKRRAYQEDIRLICAIPYKGFGLHWKDDWTERFRAVTGQANLVRYICPGYSRSAYQRRNEWMVDRSSLLIAAYTGVSGGTRNTIEYAKGQGGDCRILYLPLSGTV